MKKLILSLAVMCAFAAANAQQTIYTPKFFDNMYVGVNGGVNTNLAFDETFPVNPTASLRLGKNFNPIFGAFVEGTAWFGSHSEKNDRWFAERFDLLPGNNGAHNAVRALNVGLNGTVNLTNAILGYAGEPRPFEVSTVTGLGWGHVFTPSNAKLYTGGRDEDRDVLTAKGGLNLAYNFGAEKEHQIFLEPAVIWNLNKDGFSGIQFNKHYAFFSLQLGYNYKFGCSYGGHNFKLGRDADAEIAKLQALLDEANRRPAKIEYRDKEVIKEVVKEVPAKSIAIENLKVVPFQVNKWEISEDAQADLNTIPEGAHVQIIGTASPEGAADWNQELSENRANAVAEYLENRGVIVDSKEGHGVEGKTSNRLAVVYIK